MGKHFNPFEGFDNEDDDGRGDESARHQLPSVRREIRRQHEDKQAAEEVERVDEARLQVRRPEVRRGRQQEEPERREFDAGQPIADFTIEEHRGEPHHRGQQDQAEGERVQIVALAEHRPCRDYEYGQAERCRAKYTRKPGDKVRPDLGAAASGPARVCRPSALFAGLTGHDYELRLLFAVASSRKMMPKTAIACPKTITPPQTSS